MTMIERGNPWDDLISALKMVKDRPDTDTISPFHCEHDTLFLMATPSDFTDEEIGVLDKFGFIPDDGNACFISHRFGSA